MRWQQLLPVSLLIAACSVGATVIAQPRPATPAHTEGHAPHDDPDASAGEGPSLADGVVIDPDAGLMLTYNAVALVDAAAPVAQGRGVRVTVGEVLDRVRESPAVVRQGYAVPDGGALQELVDRMVADRLLVLEARRRGLENDPQVRAALERALVSRLRATVFNPQAGDGTAVTDEEIHAWYDAHPERFHIPERRRVRAVFTTGEARAREVLALALLRRRNRPTHEFRRLALDHNDDVTLRSMAGEVRDITPEPLVGSMELDQGTRDAIFAVTVDDEVIPRVIPGTWRGAPGFFVIQYLSRRRPEERSFEASAEWIRQRIVLERRVAVERDRVDALTREANIRRTPIEQAVRVEPRVVALTGDAGVDAGRR